MELTVTCALVLALVGLVVCNPSGYGIKGGAGAGAVAKAEANAAAFSGSGTLPKEISSPTDGISGSFSKSSASNFASSASSAYSSAYSFSGSGIRPGDDANEPPSESTKCKSGTCSTGTKGSPDSFSSGIANSAAAGSSIKTPCNSGDCQKSHNCQGTNCGNTNDHNCSSGDCGSGSAPSTHDINDIAVNVAGSAAKTSNGDETQISGSGCSNGKCDSLNPEHVNDAPSTYSNAPVQPTNKPASYLTTPKQSQPCTSPNCKDKIYDQNRPSSYNVPILGSETHPETNNPSDCVTGNCQSYPSKSPTLGTPPSNTNALVTASSTCTSPNCAGSSSPNSPQFPSVKYPQTQPNQPSYNSAFASSSVNPISYSAPKTNVPFIPLPSNKKSLPYTGGFGGPPGILKPNDFNVPSKIISSYTPTVSTNSEKPQSPTESHHPSPCSAGNCGSQPIHVSSQYDTGEKYKPSTPRTYNSSNCASGTCKSIPSQPLPNDYSAPSIVPTATPEGSHNPTTAPCSTESCGSQPRQSSPQYNPIPAYKPIGPAPEFHRPISVPKLNNYSPSFNEPSNPPGPYNPFTAPCSSGSCGSQPGQRSSQYNPSPAYKPTATTAGFDGPAGILKPIDHTTPSKVPTSKPAGSYNPTVAHCSTGNCGSQPEQSSPQYKPTAQASGSAEPSAIIITNYKTPSHEPYSKPTGSYKPIISPCSSGTCGTQPGQSSPQFYPSPAYKPKPPGFGGPSGVLNPNDYNTPSKVPPYYPSTVTCSSGSCGSQPGQPSSPRYNPSPAYEPTPTAPGLGGPAGVLKPNDYSVSSKPSTSNPAGFYNPTTASCATGSCGPQTGQSSPQYYPSTAYKPTAPVFGGPGGILKPNDYNTPSNVPPYYPSTVPCSSGSCGSQTAQLSSPQYNPSPAYKPIPTAPGFGGPSGVLKPNDFGVPSKPSSSNPAGSYNPTTVPCATGSCVPQTGQSSPQYNLSPANKPTAPSFGGPSGILKPNDYNGPSNFPTSHPPGSYNPSDFPCSTGHCGSQPGQPSLSQYDPSPAYKPTPPAPGFGGPAGVLKPNDYSVPSKLPTSNPAGSYNPTTAACATGSCGLQTGQSSPQYNPSPAYKPTVPAPGFGGPSGILKPTDHSTQSNNPNSNPARPYNPTKAPCSTGDCGSQPSQSSPQYNPSTAYTPIAPTPGFNVPAGVLKPNDYGAPPNMPSSNFKPTEPAGSYKPDAAPCATGNCGPQHSQLVQSAHQYNEPSVSNTPSTGFVGSAGISKPHYISGSTTYNSAAPCTSGNCGSSSNGPITITSGSPSSYQPNSCSSGKCGTYPNYNIQNTGATAHSAAGAIASAKAVAYTGGFGGPPGLLKPFDGKAEPGALAAAFGSKITSGQDDNRGFYRKPLEGANLSNGAQASAVAGATTGAFSGSQGDQNAKNPGGFSGGCGSSSNGSAVAGASAKSVATASAGAYAGSFASSSASAHASAGAATKGGYGK